MRLLVLGATGFVGRHLVQALVENESLLRLEKVTLVGRSQPPWIIEVTHASSIFNLVNWNLSEANLDFSHLKYDWVINLAAAKDWSEKGRHLNEAITTSTLKIIRQSGAKGVIHLSSLAVLGELKRQEMATELAPIAPDTEYGLAKAESERKIAELCESISIHVTFLRPALILGKGSQSPIDMLFKLALWTRLFPIFTFPKVEKSWTSVDLLTDLILLSIGTLPTKTVDLLHVVEKETYNYSELWQFFCRKFGWSLPIFIPRHLPFMAAKLFRKIGVPALTLEKAIVNSTYDTRELKVRYPHIKNRSLNEYLASEL